MFLFLIEIISHLLKVEIADLCANEMSGQFDRMDFGDVELGVLCCVVYCCVLCIKTVYCFIDIFTCLNNVFFNCRQLL